MNPVRAVAYVRRSTRDQTNSLERQRHDLERHAAANGITITKWYSDDGISGVEDGAARPGFTKLIADAERREFDLILVHEISRFGRFDAFQSGSWLHRLKAARVRVQAIEGAVRDPYSVQGKLLLALEQDRGESVKLSMRTLSGQRETASRGLRAGGKVPYGFARIRRKLGGVTELLGRVGRAKRDKSEIIELVPGDLAEIEAVKLMFTWARQGVGFRSIAMQLADRGIPSPDAGRDRTIARVPGRWTASAVRGILLNPAYVGDAIWNVRSSPRFHRLERDQIVPLDEFEMNRFRMNGEDDWVVRRDAHPALIDRPTFDAVQRRIHSHPSTTRGHTHEYLLTGLVTCANCGDIMVGTTRTRRKVVAGQEKTYSDPTYVCGGTLHTKGRCRQIAIPRDGFERAILKVLDEEIFCEESLERLEAAMRRELARRGGDQNGDAVAALEAREIDLAHRVAEGARRMLSVDESLLPEVRGALSELKDDLQRVRAALDARRREKCPAGDLDGLIQATIDGFRSSASILRDPTFSLERRREVLRRFLPVRNEKRPIQVHFDMSAPRGWRKSMTKVSVRHLSHNRRNTSTNNSLGSLVAGAGFEPATSGL
jgi:DNA invertase Pin-like site-specific DNA recombinase